MCASVTSGARERYPLRNADSNAHTRRTADMAAVNVIRRSVRSEPELDVLCCIGGRSLIMYGLLILGPPKKVACWRPAQPERPRDGTATFAGSDDAANHGVTSR